MIYFPFAAGSITIYYRDIKNSKSEEKQKKARRKILLLNIVGILLAIIVFKYMWDSLMANF